ncbi:MAG TPA: LPXTG cell wall anchor domain-containing protein [Candidatus Saccharimonadales bacterium]
MKKLAMFAAVIAAATALFVAPAFADSPGQLSNGDANYKVKNVTTNGEYGKSVAPKCNETVKYSILLANSDFGQLENVTVKAALPGNISISGKDVTGKTSSVSGSVNISLPAGSTLKYVNGSTNYYLYNSDGSVKSTKTLGDGVAAGGINTGTLAGSTQARVYFQAKVDCPEVPKNIEVCELATKKVITIREDQFDSKKHSKNLDDCKEVKKITVCELATKTIITINESDFDSKKHSKDLKDCAPVPPKEDEITVCETETGKVVNIKESDFDSSKYTKDLSDCAKTPVVETPAELPKTGGTDGLLLAVGAAIMTASAAYAVAARRNLLG